MFAVPLLLVGVASSSEISGRVNVVPPFVVAVVVDDDVVVVVGGHDIRMRLSSFNLDEYIGLMNMKE